MVDDLLLHGFCRWLGVSREVQPLWLIGDFQRCLQCGSDKFPNKLRHFPLANIRVAASIPLPTFSALAFLVAASSALRIGLASPVSSAPPIGTRAYRTGSRSGLCVRYSCGRSP